MAQREINGDTFEVMCLADPVSGLPYPAVPIAAPNVTSAVTDIKTAAATVATLAGALATIGIQLTGDGTGFHVTPQASMDGGATWITVGVMAAGAGGTSASISDITAIGNYLFPSGGYTHFRLLTATGITGGAVLAATLNATYATKVIRSAGIGDQADIRAAWYTQAGSLVSLLKLLIAATVGAGSHVYTFAGGFLVTDVWTVFGGVYTKTYGNDGAHITTETDWV